MEGVRVCTHSIVNCCGIALALGEDTEAERHTSASEVALKMGFGSRRLWCAFSLVTGTTGLVMPQRMRMVAIQPKRCGCEVIKMTVTAESSTTDAGKLKVAPKLESPPVDSSKQFPKVNGGLLIGTRKLAVVTGASSGLGLYGAYELAKSGDYYVVLACRNVERSKMIAKQMDFPPNSYTVVKLELGSLESVRNFVFNLKAFKGPRALDRLVCNAAVYLPTDPNPRFTEDGFEMSMGVNHLGHFLLVHLLLGDLKRSSRDPRVIIVGSITGNQNTIAGGLVYPRADLGDLDGFKQGPGFEMADGGNFFGAKAYKDSKVCNMMTVQELHRRYHESTNITFSSLYPGCIAETGLFREKRGWFRNLFPYFMKYVTGGYGAFRLVKYTTFLP